ncbi:hypothetical protein BKA70DRAFT_1460158 [Coprinopsis sp. MPI-PUGE-AT-0042]|nr:hypothetical protein BKA70DRAFT_1460158 [Coprinopsis sp. MPI-PUGE-AT-0042]
MLDLLCATTEQLGYHIPTLKALSLTCKGLSDYCQRRIFSTIAANIVIEEGGRERDIFREVNLPTLLAVVKDNPPTISSNRKPERSGSNRHLPQFFQRYLCPLLSKLTKLEALRLHNIPSLTQDVDLSQTISIFQAISSLFISYISIRNLPFAPPASPAHLSRLELLSSPLKRAENAEHHLKPINLEWFGYLNDRLRDPQTSVEGASLKAVRDSKALQFTGLRHLEFGSRFNQDHSEAAEVLQEAVGQLAELIYLFPIYLSSGGEHTSIPTSLIGPGRRTLFEQAIALRSVTFRIGASDINEDMAYRGAEWPRIFTWMIQSLTGPCWKRLDALLVSGTDLPSSLKKVSIRAGLRIYNDALGKERSRLREEWENLAKDIFKETHEKTGIVVEVIF